MAQFNINLIETRSDKRRFRIPFYYDLETFHVGQRFTCKVSNVYDPSKFWIIIRHLELDDLQLKINQMYSNIDQDLIIPRQKLRASTYCVSYIDGIYYRAEIVRVPAEPNQLEPKVVLHLIDFGIVRKCTLNEVLYMHQSLFSYPRFAIRARLDGVIPMNRNWTSAAAERFYQHTYGKILYAEITMLDLNHRAFYLSLNLDSKNPNLNVRQMLINDSLAKFDLTAIHMNAVRFYRPIYGLLAPIFRDIEKNKVHPSINPYKPF